MLKDCFLLIWFSFIVCQLPQNITFLNFVPCEAKNGSSLSSILSRGYLRCGTYEFDRIFAYAKGTDRVGFDASMCKAVAAAIFPSFTTDRVKYTTTDTNTRFSYIMDKSIDMVSRTTTKTAVRSARFGVRFGPIILFDGAGIASKKANPVTSLDDVRDTTICVPTGTTTVEVIRQFAVGKNIIVNSNLQKLDMYSSFANTGQCPYIADDKSSLTSNFNETTDRILNGAPLSKEPLAPFVAFDNDVLGSIMEVVVNGLFLAEEKHISKFNATESNDIYPASVGQGLGLSPTFMTNVIKTVGNYADIYNQFVGPYLQRSGSNQLYNIITSSGGLNLPSD